MPSVELPTEIHEHIIDCASYSSSRNPVDDVNTPGVDLKTMRACALTCRAWLPRARYHILYSLDLSTPCRINRFIPVLARSPPLGCLVKQVVITIPSCDELETTGTELFYHPQGPGWSDSTMFSRLRRLQFLKVNSKNPPRHVVPSGRPMPESIIYWAFPTNYVLSSLTTLSLNQVTISFMDDMRRIISRLRQLKTLHLMEVFCAFPITANDNSKFKATGRSMPSLRELCVRDVHNIKDAQNHFSLISIGADFGSLEDLKLCFACKDVDRLGLEVVFQDARESLHHLDFTLTEEYDSEEDPAAQSHSKAFTRKSSIIFSFSLLIFCVCTHDDTLFWFTAARPKLWKFLDAYTRAFS